MGLSREQDLSIFKKLDRIANEQTIDQILNSHIYNRSLHFSEAQLINDFILALERHENQYIDNTLRLRTSELAWEMGQLMSNVQKTFFSIGSGRLKFYPDLIDSKVYDTEWKELLKGLGKAWEAYTTYRIAVKDRLMA